MSSAEARANFARWRPAASISFMCLASCASPWQGLPPATVASEQYQDMTCDRLKNEKAELGTEAADLSPSLFPTGGEEQRKSDLAKVDGKIVAIGKKRRSDNGAEDRHLFKSGNESVYYLTSKVYTRTQAACPWSRFGQA